MRDERVERLSLTAGVWMALGAAALMSIGGCQRATTTPSAVGPSHVAGTPYPDQMTFAGDEEAAQALLKAATDNSSEEVNRVFGATAGADLLSGDPVQDRRGFERFARHAKEQWRMEKQTDKRTVVHVGTRDWPYPVPIVQGADGKWFFDTEEGKKEILARRIGRNELEVIKACRAYMEAQREYAGKDRDGSGVLKYAQHFRSTPGKTDGLYWETKPDEEQSPAGQMVADAALKGYGVRDKSTTGPRPFMGYYFHMLTKQGPDAPGGRYDYVINGNMIAGFALVASPAKHGSSGIMTFIINHQGKLYEKDLGPNTRDIVLKMTEYNPDSTWNPVKD